MGKRKKNIFDNMFDRADDISKDVRRAGRRSFGSRKKKKKSGSRRLAKRNQQELRALTEQVSLLVNHLAVRPSDVRPSDVLQETTTRGPLPTAARKKSPVDI